jgi:hypothetical protein
VPPSASCGMTRCWRSTAACPLAFSIHQVAPQRSDLPDPLCRMHKGARGTRAPPRSPPNFTFAVSACLFAAN